MTEHVELRPGQSITFVTEGVIKTPFGEKTQETKVLLSYEEILTKFQAKTATVKVPRIPKEAREFNRFSAVSQRAIEEGISANGRTADKHKSASDIVAKVTALPDALYKFVTRKAKNHLEAITENKVLKADQTQAVKDFLAKLPA